MQKRRLERERNLPKSQSQAGTQDSWLPSAECPEWRCDDYQDALHGGVRRYPQEVLGRAWLSHTSVQHLPGSFLFNADSSAGRNGQAAMWIQLIALRGCSEHPPPRKEVPWPQGALPVSCEFPWPVPFPDAVSQTRAWQACQGFILLLTGCSQQALQVAARTVPVV